MIETDMYVSFGQRTVIYDSVKSLDDLTEALKDSDPYIDIVIIESFAVDKSIVIPGGKDIIMRGLNGVKLTRAPGFKDVMIDLATSSLTIENIKIDGNKGIVGDSNESAVHVSGATLILDDVEITGNSCTEGAGVKAITNSNVVINEGTKIHDNECILPNGKGGGVFTSSGARLTINGGEIYENKALDGGGVYAEFGIVEINGGEIARNAATGFDGKGGGLFTNNSALVIDGGEIRDNVVSGEGSGAGEGGGGGVYAEFGTVLLNNGRIANNSVTSGELAGGGFYISISAKFNMINGDIDSNTAPSGGGIYFSSLSESANPHYIRGGVLQGNIAASSDITRGGGAINLSDGVILYINQEDANVPTELIDNKAPQSDGGAIYTPNTVSTAGNLENKGNLHISEDVKFSGNVAIKGVAISEAEQPLCETYVKTHDVSAPYSYAWNNLDINYRKDDEAENTFAQIAAFVNFARCEGKGAPPADLRFALYDDGGRCVSCVRAEKDGCVVFAPIEYDEAGEYHYTIRQVGVENSWWIFDRKPRYATVTVTEDEDGLKSSVAYFGAPAAFTDWYFSCECGGARSRAKVKS
jgi:pilin isopeptide linkage protein